LGVGEVVEGLRFRGLRVYGWLTRDGLTPNNFSKHGHRAVVTVIEPVEISSGGHRDESRWAEAVCGLGFEETKGKTCKYIPKSYNSFKILFFSL
jgi:hypothetical protein